MKANDTENGVKRRKMDSGKQRQGELAKVRGGTTVEATDRENGLKKEKEGQREPKTERLLISSSLSNMSPLHILPFQTDGLFEREENVQQTGLGKEEEIRNNVKNENGFREMETVWKGV